VATLFSQHVNKWKNCRLCPLCETRQKTVFARGDIPCHVLFIGEAPGESENVIGLPFVGPAGMLLDSIISEALMLTTIVDASKVKMAMGNLLCCIPRDEEGGKVEAPPERSVIACRPRLKEFVEIADPRLIVCVGSEARDWLDEKRTDHIRFHREIPAIDILHPAYILRSNIARRSMMIRRSVIILSQAIDKRLGLR
jgi:DNA polymerase